MTRRAEKKKGASLFAAFNLPGVSDSLGGGGSNQTNSPTRSFSHRLPSPFVCVCVGERATRSRVQKCIREQ